MTGFADWPTLLLLIASFWVGAGFGYAVGWRAKQLDTLSNGKNCKPPS